MIKNRKRAVLVVALGLALLAQLMNPTGVHADGETPSSPSDTAAETATVAPTAIIVAETPTPEPTALSPDKPGVDVIPIESLTRIPADAVEAGTPLPPAGSPESPDKPAGQVASTPDPVEATPSAVIGNPRVPALGDVLRDLPENTNVIVLDEIGKPLPLASQEAAQVITESDPIWCPAGQAPTPGLNGCTSSYATLAALVTAAGPSLAVANGTIWITSGQAADPSPVTINGSLYPNWAVGTLTLQGGWSGISGDTTIDPNSISVFSVPITITNWNNGVVIQNIDATSINLSNVTSQGSGIGVSVTNTSSNVYLDNIEVDRAIGTGLHVDTQGTISGHNITSTNNIRVHDGPCPVQCGNGAFLVGANGVTLTGTNVFTGNGWSGLDAWSVNGDTTLENVTASNNGGFGGALGGSGNVTISGTSSFNNNGVYGAYINGTNVSLSGTTEFLYNVHDIGLSLYASENVTLNSVVARGNAGGIHITSNYGEVHLDNVTIDQSSGFGLGIFTGGGNVTINNSSFTNTSADANNLTLSWGDGADIFTSGGSITITGSHFTDNDFDGLYTSDAGNITINNSQFTGNDVNGLSGFSAGNVTIDLSHFSGNLANGLNMFASGDISINQSQFDGNFSSGFNGASDGDITIDQSQFTRNLANGLAIGHAGNVTLNNITADHNGIGVSISNTGNVTLSGGALSNNSTGLNVFCVQSVNFTVKPQTSFIGNLSNIVIDPACPIDIVPPQALTVLKTQGELFRLDCATKLNRYVVRLANGDRGEIFCPVDGEASIDRVDNTTLPANLPAGYMYASAFDVEIILNDKPLRWIVEGGYITASFLAQNSQSGNVYSILYWDQETRTWIPLKNLLLDSEGKPEVLALFPGVDGDRREIRSGVNLVTKNGETRVEVSTNFPGIFVLAQQ